jgi:hypothetical protein
MDRKGHKKIPQKEKRGISPSLSLSRIVTCVQSLKEIIIRTSVNLLELNQHTNTHVQFPCLILGIATPRYITSAPLQLRAKLLLRNVPLVPQSSQIISDTPVTTKLLFHYTYLSIAFFDQYRLQLILFYDIIRKNIVRDTGQYLRGEVKIYDMLRNRSPSKGFSIFSNYR